MRKFTILSATFLLLIFPSYSQTITGTYKGKLYQDPDKSFYFEIRIDKSDGKGNISGTTYIESYDKSISKLSDKGDFGTIEFTGTYKGNSVTIYETKIIKEDKKSSNYYWCIKTSTLTLTKTDTQWKLSGSWTAPGGCPPGTLSVHKTIPKTDPVVIKDDKKDSVIVKHDTIKIKPDPVVVKIDTLENRVVETKDQVNVVSNTITIEVWDHNLIDGDIISLNLNGEWILESYALQKEKKLITLKLTQKENTLILHAINLGSSPPNTASMIINDGTNSKTLVLNSDKGKSEAVKIVLQ